MTSGSVQLVVRRRIGATAERLFHAWTTASELRSWWGPDGVACTHAEIDARVGGRYRIGNALADGRVVWISGEFLEVVRPSKLVFTWTIEPSASEPELVTVLFEPVEDGTEVVVIHERIASEQVRGEHQAGWAGCLDGLAVLTAGPPVR